MKECKISWYISPTCHQACCFCATPKTGTFVCVHCKLYVVQFAPFAVAVYVLQEGLNVARLSGCEGDYLGFKYTASQRTGWPYVWPYCISPRGWGSDVSQPCGMQSMHVCESLPYPVYLC